MNRKTSTAKTTNYLNEPLDNRVRPIDIYNLDVTAKTSYPIQIENKLGIDIRCSLEPIPRGEYPTDGIRVVLTPADDPLEALKRIREKAEELDGESVEIGITKEDGWISRAIRKLTGT